MYFNFIIKMKIFKILKNQTSFRKHCCQIGRHNQNYVLHAATKLYYIFPRLAHAIWTLFPHAAMNYCSQIDQHNKNFVPHATTKNCCQIGRHNYNSVSTCYNQILLPVWPAQSELCTRMLHKIFKCFPTNADTIK